MRCTYRQDSYVYITTYQLISGRIEARDNTHAIHDVTRFDRGCEQNTHKYDYLKPRYLKRQTGDDVRDVEMRYVPTKMYWQCYYTQQKGIKDHREHTI
jgi:hypothetical protein